MSIVEFDKKYILHPFSTYSENKLNILIKNAYHEFLVDENGNEIVDAISSWWVNTHGHTHPYIVHKMTEQLGKLEHVIFSGFIHEPAISFAEKVLSHFNFKYAQLFYSDNGSTAVEVALKMTIQYWKNKGENRNKFIAFTNAYHGDTFGAMSVSERDVFTQHFTQHLFHVEYIPIPTEDNLDDVMQLLETILESEKIAGFIFEPLVQGAGGMRMYQAEHLDFLLKLCKDYDVITIADEVMTGFGRTGKMFASEHLYSTPDFICLSKGITGGFLPLGVTLFTEEISSQFKSAEYSKTFYHGHSFTGNPISLAAANASWDLFQIENTMDKIKQIHEWLLDIADEFDLLENVSDVRVTGSILAFDVITNSSEYFYTNPIKDEIYHYCLSHHVLIRPLGNVVYILPPYCISYESLSRVSEVIKKCMIEIGNK